MKFEIEIDSARTKNLTLEGKNALNSASKIYIENIVDEASRIEQVLRENGANAEITSNHIQQAVNIRKKSFYKKPKYLTPLKIINPIVVLLTGFLFDMNGFQGKSIQLIAFIICLLLSTSTIIIINFKENE